MAKGDKQDVARAKSAFREKGIKEVSKNYMSKTEYKRLGTKASLPKETTQKLVKAKGSAKAGTLSPKAASNAAAKINRARIQADYPKATPKSVSPTKPSMPVKQGVKNKMKAQGAKAMGGPTSGYGKSTKPKGK